jgi:ariadne-2
MRLLYCLCIVIGWLCKGNWSGHTSCGKFAETSNEAKAANKAKNDLEKYMHYFTRFDNHAKSIKFAEKTRIQVRSLSPDVLIC